MNFGYCRMCGNNMPDWMYSTALFCSESCRKRYWDIKHGRSPPKKPEKDTEAVGKTVSCVFLKSYGMYFEGEKENLPQETFHKLKKECVVKEAKTP